MDEASAAGETIRRGPEPALYRGAVFGYSQVDADGVILLTDRRLLFRKLTGGRVDVPIEKVAGVRKDKVFLGAYRSGREHLILHLSNRDAAGFLVADPAAWSSAIEELMQDRLQQ